MNSNIIFKFMTTFVVLNNICINKLSVNSLNASEIDSFVLLHDRVKNTLIEIAINGRCDSPKPTVVYVNETKDKLYLPRATILYRCSDQFACCPNPRHSCLASNEEVVEIGFYTLTKTEDQITERNIEVLKFNNHTKCNCRRKERQITKEFKDILLTSDSSKQEFHSNSTLNEKNSTKTTLNTDLNQNKTTISQTFIEKDIKIDNKTVDNIGNKNIVNNSDVNNPENNYLNTTLNPLKTESQQTNGNSEPKITTHFYKTTKSIPMTTKPIPLTISSTKVSTIKQKNSKTERPSIITTSRPNPVITKSLISSTNNFLIYSKVNQNLNSNTTLEVISKKTSLTTERIFMSTTPTPPTTTTTITVRSSKTSVPLIKSSINYEELEREEDLNPEEDVVYNNGNGFNLFYTNGIFFRPLTTTPYRSHKSVERVTKKCSYF